MQPNVAMKELGLTQQESLIYLSLLKTGGNIASNVAREVGIKRTTVYALLKCLAEKGFVTTYYRKSKQLFYAEKPMKVANYYERKLEAFTSMIPMLESLEKKETQKSGLRFIETVEELKRFYAGILTEYKGKQYCVIGSAGAWEGLEPAFFIQYRKDRAKAKIKTRILLTEESRSINPKGAELLRSVKFLPEKYHFKSTIDIFGDRILIVSPELSSLAVVIAIPAMTDIFKGMFEMLWEQS